MGKKGKARARKRARSSGQFTRREPAVAAPDDTPEPLADSLCSPMEADDEPLDDDDDWHDEDAGAASGAGQTVLSFRSATAAAVVSAAAVRTVQNLCPEIAPPRRAAQLARPPCRQTVHRRKQAALGAAKQGMARFMSSWLGSGAGQQPSLPQKPETEGAADMEEESPVPADACSAEPRGDGESKSESESESDMLCDGADLPLQDWVGEDVQEQAQGVLGEHCDGYLSEGDGGFLDGFDYTSELSDGSPHDGKESGAELDGEVQHGNSGGSAATGECSSGCATITAAKQPAPAVRRSSRETSSKSYAPARRASANREERGGPGRGTRVLLPDEVQKPLLRLNREGHKKKRAARREEAQKSGSEWTKEEREEARRARTRENISERKTQLIATFKEGLKKIDEAGNDLSSLVEDPDRMLTQDRLTRVCRVIATIRAYLVLEIREGVQKVAHSHAVGAGAGVDAKTVRRWVTEFCEDGKFVVPDRTYVKRQAFSYIDDEDIRERCREYIDQRIYRRKKGERRFRVADFQRWVNTECLKAEFAEGGGICRSTAHNWIAKLGFRWRRHGKCVYVDGHNRPDVVEARRFYTEKMLAMRRLMSIPEKVETVVVVKVRDAGDREEASTDDGDDHVTEEVAIGKEPVLWPAVRTMPGGRVDCKHVLVYGDRFSEATGDERCCTRIPIDEGDLKMRDRGGHYSLVPAREVQKCYQAKRVEEEALFWPAKRVLDGKEEYKHVRVLDEEHPRGDCKRSVTPDCTCHDCNRTPFVDSSRVPFNRLDLSASDNLGDFRLLPDHEVLALYFHDETTAKENDDGGCQWMSAVKGAAIKKKGEGRAVHVSDIIGVDRGVAVIGKEAWGMMQEDKSVECGPIAEVEAHGPATEDGTVPRVEVVPQYYGRSGIYFGRKEGDGVEGHAVKFIQDAVELLKALPAACGVTKTRNDPSTGAVIMTVGQNLDGYWNNERMCTQILGLIAIHELTSEAHRPMVMVFDNSTGHAAYDGGALLASHIQLRPGGSQSILDDFNDDDGNLVHTTFREGDTLRFTTSVAKTPQQLKAEKEKAGKDPNYKPDNSSSLGQFRKGTVVQKTGRTADLIGVPKGGKQLLLEMGLWDAPGEGSLRLLECNACLMEKAATREAITAFNRGGEGRQQALDDAARRDQDDGEDGESPGEGAEGGVGGDRAGRRRRCCVKRVFSELRAFKQELNKIEKIFKKAGHVCIFLAKYHPELNAIERYWGYVKHLLRLYCEYSLPHMLKVLPGALSGVPVGFIRAWSRVTWLYLEAYDEGLVDYLEVRDLKKWLSHRSPTDRGDAVVMARAGAGKSEEEKKKAEDKALAAAQELRTKSVRRAKKIFKGWKQKKGLRYFFLKKTWRVLTSPQD